ncbi:hypothetical protein OMAG_001459 [Candidatus Omnitrophus magneticus]|uniref:Uncharacterized protein n=1 Tax=Candidatus Omnitrophus magneticus TaxID=1609969 RepID=A0A0F0CN43_9BACT|nr:hypothetical protein OMAG_001459 [Candidatus Omnitrophus magneticus]
MRSSICKLSNPRGSVFRDKILPAITRKLFEFTVKILYCLLGWLVLRLLTKNVWILAFWRQDCG